MTNKNISKYFIVFIFISFLYAANGVVAKAQPKTTMPILLNNFYN